MKLLICLSVLFSFAQANAWTIDREGNIEFSVLAYNVKCLPFPKKCTKAKMKRIGEILNERRQKGTAPDVVMIQEGFDDDINYLVDNAGYKNKYYGPARNDKHPDEKSQKHLKVTGSGLIILSDLPFIHAANRPFKSRDCTSWDCYSNKGMALVNMNIGGQLISFVTTHMNAGEGEKKDLMRVHQIEDAARFLNDYYNTNHPLVFAGDFNTKPHRDSWIPMTKKTNTSVVGELCLKSQSCTVDPETVLEDVVKNTNDHHLLAKQQLSRLFPVHLERNFAEKIDDGQELSDHLGYEVRYRLITK